MSRLTEHCNVKVFGSIWLPFLSELRIGCAFRVTQVTKYSCWSCIFASGSYWELISSLLCFMMITFYFWLFFLVVAGHTVRVYVPTLFDAGLFLPNSVSYARFCRIASITFSLDEAVKHVFPSVKSAKRGMKGVRSGTRLWTRCDAKPGYVHDTTIFPEKEIFA